MRSGTNLDRLLDAIDEQTALVPLSLVLFKSAFIQDARAVIEKAHRVGAHVILDVYQAAGTVPMHLEALGADFAVGGSVKWLCGGPGAGYLYVRPDLAATLAARLVGWAAHERPFEFETGPCATPTRPERFQSGTPNVPALYAGARRLRDRRRDWRARRSATQSLRLTRRLIDAAPAAGYPSEYALEDDGARRLRDRRRAGRRAVADELLRRGVIVDYRPGAGIRIAPHFYNTRRGNRSRGCRR